MNETAFGPVFCEYCGQQIPAGSKVCPSCHADVGRMTQSGPQGVMQEQEIFEHSDKIETQQNKEQFQQIGIQQTPSSAKTFYEQQLWTDTPLRIPRPERSKVPTWDAFPARAGKRKKSFARRLIFLLLVAVLLILALYKPGYVKIYVIDKYFPDGFKWENTGEQNMSQEKTEEETDKPDEEEEKPEETIEEEPAITDTEEETEDESKALAPIDSRELSDEPEKLPEWIGNSEALDFSPAEGIQIHAEENALYEDTELTMEALAEGGEEVLRIADEIASQGDYLIGAYSVHAGLKEGEHLPGEYEVSINLETLGLDSSLYSAARIFRLSEDGALSELASSMDGEILSYRSDENSIIAVSLTTPALARTALSEAETAKADWYYYSNSIRLCSKEYTNEYGSYTIYWSMKDLDPLQEEELLKIARIEEEQKEKAKDQEKRNKNIDKDEDKEDNTDFDPSVENIFTKNLLEAKNLKENLEKDDEYQTLQKELWVPEPVDYMHECIDRAWAYLAEEENILTPIYNVAFNVSTRSGFHGIAQSFLGKRSAIEIDFGDTKELFSSEEGDGRRADLLLAVTCELFKTCQNRYHTRYFIDSERFDEMTASVFMDDAFQYYTEQGIITTEQPITLAGNWGVMRLPIDEVTDYGTAMRLEGYTLSDFVRYLREKTGDMVSVGKIMNLRSYYRTSSTSKPLSVAFGLSSLAFDNYFKAFAVDNRLEAGKKYYDDLEAKPYHMFPEIKLKKNEGSHVVFETEGDYTFGVRGFRMYTKASVPALLVADHGVADAYPGVNLIPAENGYSITSEGIYFEPKEHPMDSDDSNHLYRKLLEVYGKQGAVPEKPMGYTMWAMDSPDRPKLSIENEKLLIKLPKPTGVAEAGATEGIRLTIKAPNGKFAWMDFDPSQYTDTEVLELSALQEMLENKSLEDYIDKEEFSVTVTICDFVMSDKGEYCLGKESYPVTIFLEPEEEPEGRV